MDTVWKISKVVCAVLLISILAVIAFNLTYRSLYSPPAGEKATVDYINIVVILLTTVTVAFTFFAIALAVLGAIGFNNLKKDAGKYAAQKAIDEIKEAFSKDGLAFNHIDSEFRREDGHLRPWMTDRIRQEVILLLPLVADRIVISAESGLAAGEPTDEGETA